MLAGIVPVNRLDEAKTRLLLPKTGPDKRAFILAMIENVVSAAVRSTLDVVYIVSEDVDVLKRSKNLGAEPVKESVRNGPNAAVALANSRARAEGATATLVLFSDLPLIEAADVDGMIDVGMGEGTNVVASPSVRGGTNALWRSPPEVIPTRYGENSFNVHQRECALAGVPFHEFHSDGMRLDVDTVEDYMLLLNMIRARKQPTIITRLLKT